MKKGKGGMYCTLETTTGMASMESISMSPINTTQEDQGQDQG